MTHFLGQCEECEEIEEFDFTSLDSEESIPCANCGGKLIRKTFEEIESLHSIKK